MGCYYRTNLRCTKPEIIASGSSFAQSTKSEIINTDENEIHYFTNNDVLHEELLDLSKEHPDVSFTAKTWCDSEYYAQIVWTLIYTNGSYEKVNREPRYLFSWSCTGAVDDSMIEEFRRRISQFLDRSAPHKLFPQKERENKCPSGQYYNDGLIAYVKFIWETEDYRFTAENKHGYLIKIKYESKDKENLKRLRIDNKILREQLNDTNDNFDIPF